MQVERFGTDTVLPLPPALLSLADLQRKQVKRGRADEYLLQTLKMKEEVLGRDHPLVLNILMALATSFKSQGRWKEAEERATEVLATREKKLPQHPYTITAMIHLGQFIFPKDVGKTQKSCNCERSMQAQRLKWASLRDW